MSYDTMVYNIMPYETTEYKAKAGCTKSYLQAREIMGNRMKNNGMES